MRWLVEVSALGKEGHQEHHVEADTWQRALQEARSRRGEAGPMSGFSIELLEEGYRAVDPVARVRFVVKRAADDKGASQPPPSGAPRPGDGTARSASAKPTLVGVGGVVPRPAKVGGAVAGMPKATIVSSRVQEPSEAMPLAYREYAFALPTGTSDDVAAALLKAQLAFVQSDLEATTASKLVQLAAFDVAYSGKPTVLPLATLTWKDWKGEPTVAFPRRSGGNVPMSSPSRPPPSMPPSPPSAPKSAPPSAPKSAPPPAPKSVPAPAPAVVPVIAAPAPAPALSAPPAAPVVTADPFASAPPAYTPPPEPLVRTPSGRFIRGRMSGDELITSLFEAMHDLHFKTDALDGGQFCLALATEMLPARAALIHFFDIDKREWVVACTRGKDMAALLATRSPESDDVLKGAAKSRRAVVHTDASAFKTSRYGAAGGAQSVVVAPIMQAGRALGALEIINPLDGNAFNTDEGNAVTYIAEQYAEYLGSRGIVVDEKRIRAAAAGA